MNYTYYTKGTCSRKIILDIDGDILRSVRFEGGCNGNLKGIGSLCAGMKIDDIIKKLKGTTCGFKSTSCPDQLAIALEEYRSKGGK